jgi:hypothetical protein
MPNDITQEALDARAHEIADLIDDLPWCECTGYLVVQDDEGDGDDPELNEYLQAFDVSVFDGYVTDFLRIVRSLHESLQPRIEKHEIVPHLSSDYTVNEDPNLVPLSLMIHFHGPDHEYLNARHAVLETMEAIVRRAVEEWAQEDEEPAEALV